MAADSGRRLERERVLELLYESEMKQIGVDQLLEDLPVVPAEFVRDLIVGVDAEKVDLDAEIKRRAINWDIDRLALIDRLILRIGVWELLHRPEVPVAVVISEAVELAKQFSTESSGKFVNGVLGSFEDRR